MTAATWAAPAARTRPAAGARAAHPASRPVEGSVVLGLLPVQPVPREAWAWPLEASETAASSARRHARWFLERCQGIPDELADDCVLIASELTTNACAATLALASALAEPVSLPAVELSLRLFNDRLLIEVTDASPDPPVLSPECAPAAEHGRGLTLVDEMSREWGYFRHQDKKVVYSILQTTPARTQPLPASPACQAVPRLASGVGRGRHQEPRGRYPGVPPDGNSKGTGR